MEETYEVHTGISIENIERDNGFDERVSEWEELSQTDTNLAGWRINAFTKCYDSRTSI